MNGGPLLWDCAELALSFTFVTHCVTQVMNMYGDLVMDAAPEKVGKACAHTHIYPYEHKGIWLMTKPLYEPVCHTVKWLWKQYVN